MRFLILVVTVLLLDYCSSEILTKVSTPSSFITNFTELSSNDTNIEGLGSDESTDDGEDSSMDERIHDSEDDENEDDSDISEERNEVDFDSRLITKAPDIIVSHINQTFGNKFSCPRVKTDLFTGTSVGDLSPEDIKYIASMGDGVASGVGLYDGKMLVEFRGASFASGGDANLEGLVTIPNILREFSPTIQGMSHGMSNAGSIPRMQLSVSSAGATTKDLPKQARALIERFQAMGGSATNDWIMIIIAVGTEEICASCSPPDEQGISDALSYLHSAVRKALVVLLGPTHVSHQSLQKKNILKQRCNCSKNQPPGFMEALADQWIDSFNKFQQMYDEKMEEKQTWGLLAIPQLTVTSRTPGLLFHPDQPIINRRGHTYMSKWLWNRLMTGERYNLSSAVLSSDSYYCPSSGCPYFRTTANMRRCAMLSIADAENNLLIMSRTGVMNKAPRRTRKTLYSIAVAIVVISTFVALIVGIILYHISKRGVRGRFEEVPATVAPTNHPASTDRTSSSDFPAPISLSRQSGFQRQSTRRTLDVPSPVFGVGAADPAHKMSDSTQLLSES